MNKLLAMLVAGFLATSSFAASHTGAPMTSPTNPQPVEAMKPGDRKAQGAAQARVDARSSAADKAAMQPEAMKAGSEKAQARAEMKKAQKAKIGKKNSTDEQMKKDAAKL